MYKCPECHSKSSLHREYPFSQGEAILEAMRIIRLRRCVNCNAAVFLILGIYPTTRRRWKRFSNWVAWSIVIMLALFPASAVVELLL